MGRCMFRFARDGHLHEHIVPFDLDRIDLDRKIIAGKALARLKRKGLLVDRAGNFGNAVRVAEQTS